MHTINRTDQAGDWLAETLAHGPRPRTELIAEAETLGHSRTTLQRAADQLGIISEPQPTWPRRTTWRLP